MRKYLLLLVLGAGIFATLVYFYIHSESRLAHKHQDVLQLFLRAKTVEASLEKDLLESRAFLLLNYDLLVQEEAEVERICSSFRSDAYGLSGTFNHDIDASINAYCDAMEAKVEKVESFKSRNAILKNSVSFLQKIASQNIEFAGHDSREEGLRIRVVNASLAYALVSTADAKLALEKAIVLIDRSPALHGLNELDATAKHASKILEIKDELDRFMMETLDSKSHGLLDKLRASYFTAYENDQKNASSYRRLLFGACLLFLSFVLYAVVRVWSSAQALAQANTHLEKRVEERTLELSSSEAMIMQQQNILVSLAKMSALGEMAGGIAHEINNPLATIKSLSSQISEILSDDPLDKEMLSKMSQSIEKTADRIAKIVQGLRAFSREGSHDNFQPVGVNYLIEDTVSLCQERFKSHEIRLIVEPLAAEVAIEARASEISQVLLNLLNNAHDAIEMRDVKWVTIGAWDEGDSICIHVTDSGDGLAEEVREKIFQPFFTTKEIGKGTGLGLSISLGIIKGHQGILSVDEHHAHTRFIVRLPKHQDPATSTAA
ncbi:MAG: DAHL domain-containing protein [Bdellovibrionota bacterium]